MACFPGTVRDTGYQDMLGAQIMNDENLEQGIRNRVENTIQGICKELWVAMGMSGNLLQGVLWYEWACCVEQTRSMETR